MEKEYNTCVKHLKLVELHSNSKDEIIEKQQKLLELYRELNNKILHTYDIFGRMTNKEWKKFADIQQQIKELENES